MERSDKREQDLIRTPNSKLQAEPLRSKRSLHSVLELLYGIVERVSLIVTRKRMQKRTVLLEVFTHLVGGALIV